MTASKRTGAHNRQAGHLPSNGLGVALLNPCFRHTSAVSILLTCSRSTAMIYTSLYLIVFTSVSS
jgi:hypothetical protein